MAARSPNSGRCRRLWPRWGCSQGGVVHGFSFGAGPTPPCRRGPPYLPGDWLNGAQKRATADYDTMSEPAVESWRRVLCPGDPLMRLRLIFPAHGLTTLNGAACSSADPSTVIAGDSTTAVHTAADVLFSTGLPHNPKQRVDMRVAEPSQVGR